MTFDRGATRAGMTLLESQRPRKRHLTSFRDAARLRYRARAAALLDPEAPLHTLLFLDPGHFHAALLLRRASPRIAPDVHVYAPAGAERDAFCALIEAFNAREQDPTRWRAHVHEARDRDAALAALLAERRGDAVVLAGRNRGKLAAIARLHEAGLWVLADKPWVTADSAPAALARACRGAPLAMDIMPDRHELLARLRRRIIATPELFGELATDDPAGPAIELSSTHHLFKVVNGAPLRRPAWYYDVREQGDGLVDVQSHLTDQAQWLVAPERDFDFDTDVEFESARRWATPVPAELFRDSTGEAAFPAALAPWVRDGVLRYPCNGEIRYRLCGVPVRQLADWGAREPDGGCDLHGATVRGTRAVLAVEQGRHTGFEPRVSLAPRPGVALDAVLRDAVAGWQHEFPGLATEAQRNGFRFVAPAALHTTHESHFALELARFLDCMDAGTWPAHLQAQIETRHRILFEASALARGQART
jgi:predicted dehydrogenase